MFKGEDWFLDAGLFGLGETVVIKLLFFLFGERLEEAGESAHQVVQLLLGEVVLEVLLPVGLVHVHFQVVVPCETLITHGAPHA